MTMSKFYVVPEERLKDFIRAEKELCYARDSMFYSPSEEELEATADDLKEFFSVDCIDNQTSIDPAIMINSKPIHDDIFVDFADNNKSITQQATLPFNVVQQHSMQDMFKDKQ